MPSTLFSPRAELRVWGELNWPQRAQALRLWTYRFGIYAAINLLDEPAWLALMFC